jgi:hypothetical protein
MQPNQKGRAIVDDAVSAYSDEELIEQAQWGEFALGEFPYEPSAT